MLMSNSCKLWTHREASIADLLVNSIYQGQRGILFIVSETTFSANI